MQVILVFLAGIIIFVGFAYLYYLFNIKAERSEKNAQAKLI